MDIFGNGLGDFDITAYGFTQQDFDALANAILAEVDFDYFRIPQGTTAVPAGQDLRVDFMIGDVGTAPVGVTEYYYVQIGTGISGPHTDGTLGVAGGSVVRNTAGSGPNSGIQVGDIVASVFTNAIVTMGGLTPSDALTSGNLNATKHAVAGTLSHEIGHTLSLDHIDKAGVTTPTGLPPIMGTGAIDLPNQDRINDREFSISGQNIQNGGATQMHIAQLVGAVGTHNTSPAAVPGAGFWTVTLGADQTVTDVNFGNRQVTGTGAISGTLWDDADGDGVFDTGEAPLSGWEVYLDLDDDGTLDAGEPTQMTAADGTYTFSGLPADTYVVREVVQTGWEQTFPSNGGGIPTSEFDIEVVFPDSSLTPAQQAVFTQAAQRWSEIIIGDVPDVFVDGIGLVDDITISATAPAIDGVGGILGQAGPDRLRAGSNLPVSGVMQFDTADVANLVAQGRFEDVILHEMGHVLGIGTIWSYLGLRIGTGGADPRFIGPQATAEYNAIFNITASSVPVENTGGPGTRDAHWRESDFSNELMTGFLNSGVSNPISRIAVGSLADMGYTVNLDAADSYTPPSGLQTDTASSTLGGRLRALELPVAFLRPYVYGPQPAAPALRDAAAAVDAELLAATAFLPVGMTVEQFAEQIDVGAWLAARAARPAVSDGGFSSLTAVGESEPNDSFATANAVPLGFDPAEDVAVDVSGILEEGSNITSLSTTEENGAVPFATPTGLVDGGMVVASSTIGDGAYGSTTGDFDWFSLSSLAAGDVILVDVDASDIGSSLDPLVAIYDGAGNFLEINDDRNSLDSYLEFAVPTAGDYYVSISSFVGSIPLQSDPFDPSSGPGANSTGFYNLKIGRNFVKPVDTFQVELNAGDILGANVSGGAGGISVFDAAGNLIQSSMQDFTVIHPNASPLPGGGNAAASFVARATGTYYVQVSDGTGAYDVNLRVFRPALEQQSVGTKQILFLDFDGATVNPADFGGSSGSATLSPLSSFLSGWGLSSADENAVIDAVIASVEESLRADIRQMGANGDFDTTGNPGEFAIEILNSRDHADPFGNSNVSRVIVGGTIAQLGISTIGIAETIDVGNFETAEFAVVLLDLLSAAASDPNSLNSFPLGGSATKIDLIGTGVGNIVAHEAGHIFGNWHTDQFNATANIMDQGGFLPNTVGVGPDGIFGTADDADVDFVTDAFVPNEGFLGNEDTLRILGK